MSRSPDSADDDLHALAVEAVVGTDIVDGLEIGVHQPEGPAIRGDPAWSDLRLVGTGIGVSLRGPGRLLGYLLCRMDI